jgi:glycine cleavage system regulatory protein
MRRLVMTVIGEDRPGLVEALARVVASHNGNWLESQLSRLGGRFAGSVRIEVPEEQEQALVQALQHLRREGLTIVTSVDYPEPQPSRSRWNVLEIIGQDRPGIVRQITRALAEYGVNVEELRTECLSAPMSGETLFKARAHLRLPEKCDVAVLRQELEKIAADLIVEISLKDVETPESARS